MNKQAKDLISAVKECARSIQSLQPCRTSKEELRNSSNDPKNSTGDSAEK